MIKLYHAPQTRSFRILWFLEELKTYYDLEYEIERVEFIPPAKGFFTQKTPSGKIPFLTDGDSQLSESAAILQYLLERYDSEDRFSPKIGTPERATFLQWLHYTEGTLSTPLSTLLWHMVYKRDADQLPSVIVDAKDRAERSLTVAEHAFTDNVYLIDNIFSAADIMLGFTLWNAKQLGALTGKFKKLGKYLQTLEERPALKHALQLQ